MKVLALPDALQWPVSSAGDGSSNAMETSQAALTVTSETIHAPIPRSQGE